MAEPKRNTRIIPLVAVVLAWLVPGAGHVYIGRVARGGILFVVIAATFWSGVAMGGAMTVDARRERWWFMADMFTGVHGLSAWRISESALGEVLDEAELPPPLPPGSRAAFERNARVDAALAERGLALTAPTATVARAYAGVAGLVNLLCMFDALILALMGRRGEPTGREHSPPPDQRRTDDAR